MKHTLSLLLAVLCTVASARLSCKVPNLGGGRDDGPAINAAFQRCAKNGKVVLDKYYLVDTLLFTTGLDDVEIELSGTGMHDSFLCPIRDGCSKLCSSFSAVHA